MRNQQTNNDASVHVQQHYFKMDNDPYLNMKYSNNEESANQ